MLDFAYDTALDVGKFEYDTWKDILSKLPSENELRWAYNQSKTENSGPSMSLPNNFNHGILLSNLFWPNVRKKCSSD